MKTIILAALIFLTSNLHAQDADGYYINKSGDTVRGKVSIPMHKKLKWNASSQTNEDPLKDDVTNEAAEIDYSSLTFDFKFSEGDNKPKKIDRLKVLGFGFTYKDRQYDFVTWDVSANKQIYFIQPTGNVVADGVYFILRSIDGAFPIYSLFQEVEMYKRKTDNRPEMGYERYDKKPDGYATKRDVIFEHPTKGMLYISDQYPLRMKFAQTLEYLELEDEFIKKVGKHDEMLEVVRKYNKWKKSLASKE